jgi:HAD superfamily hydrolase (TIGR01509 family)
MINHVSFDLDGTLISSELLMAKSWEYATSNLGIESDFETYRSHVGLPFPEILKLLNLSPYLSDLRLLYFRFATENMDLITINPGAFEVLQRLRDRQFTISLITSKPNLQTNLVLEKFKLDFDVVISADDLKHGKPHPDGFYLLFEKANLRPESILYVGDTLIDLQFSINGRTKYVHYTRGFQGNLNPLLLNKVPIIQELEDLVLLL